MTTKRVKNSSDEPRSRSATITSTANAHAASTGRKARGSGRCSGPTFHVPPAISWRLSAR